MILRPTQLSFTYTQTDTDASILFVCMSISEILKHTDELEIGVS